MQINSLIRQYDFNLGYTEALVDGVKDEEMTHIPSPLLVNHPAWTIGHLVSGSSFAIKFLGAPNQFPKEWRTLFNRSGPGDPRQPDKDEGQYPSKLELLGALNEVHEKVKALLLSKEAKELEASLQWRFANYMPTVLDAVVFMCINHEAMHLGQLAAWRRAMGFESALASMPHTPKPY